MQHNPVQLAFVGLRWRPHAHPSPDVITMTENRRSHGTRTIQRFKRTFGERKGVGDLCDTSCKYGESVFLFDADLLCSERDVDSLAGLVNNDFVAR